MSTDSGDSKLLSEIITTAGLDPNYDLSGFNATSILWAFLQKDLNVYINTENGQCDFLRLCNKCDLSSKSCSCSIDTQSNYIIIRDIRRFLDLMVLLHQTLKERNDLKWLYHNSEIGLFNNASQYELENAEVFIERIIGILKNTNMIQNDFYKHLGNLDLAKGTPSLIYRIEQAESEQESPYEFIVNLSESGTISSENELHRVRFGLIDNETAVVTSVQSAQLEYTKKRLTFEMQRFYNAISDVFSFEGSDRFYKIIGAGLPQGILSLYHEYLILSSRGDFSEIDYASPDVVSFIAKARQIFESASESLESIKVPKLLFQLYQTFLILIRLMLQESSKLEQYIATWQKYQNRDSNSRLLNSDMRMKRGFGHLSGENSSSFSLATFIFWARKQGIKNIRLPISFPLRDSARLPSTSEYIVRKKHLLVERIAVELGVAVELIENGTCYLIDISNISPNREIFRTLEQKIEMNNPQEG